MKRVLLGITLLCASSFSFTQERDKIKVKKTPTEIDFLPQIAGMFDGELAVDKICFGGGIKNNLGYQVFSFDITYVKEGTTVTESYRSNQIPDSVCVQLQMFNINQRIFFTAIKALDHKGRLITLDPLSLIPIKEDE